MHEKESEQLNGMCPHGNFPSTCETCNSLNNPAEDKLINKETQSRSLAYTPELKASLEMRPGIIKQVLKLVKTLESQPEGASVEENGLTVTYFQKRNWSQNFKIESLGETYFLRKELGRGTGYKAMDSFAEAKRRIGNRNDVRLIDSQLGYTDNEGNDYFVAKWENLPTMADYLGQDLSDTEREEIAEKLGFVYDTLEDYKDVTTSNMFYDPEHKQVVLFDLEKEDQS